ncbi:MAG: substrate-binding domain-containing protein [Desulfuromonadia bacterium]
MDSGLLDTLVPLFERQTGIRTRVLAVGSGQALKLGGRGEVDLIISHAPHAEERFMTQGKGSGRVPIFENDFLLVGPTDDPARVRSLSADDGFRRIAAGRHLFVSRGDDSGTDQAEKGVWHRLGIIPQGQSWYQESDTGMGQTLIIASEKRAYTVTDRGTWLAFSGRLSLTPLGTLSVTNRYHLILVNPRLHPKVNAQGAERFRAFLRSPETTRLVGRFGADRFGVPLFRPVTGER